MRISPHSIATKSDNDNYYVVFFFNAITIADLFGVMLKRLRMVARLVIALV